MCTERRRLQTVACQGVPVSILDLPVELLYQILEYLPLSGQILFRTQINRLLRVRLAPRVTLSRRGIFSLVEWRQAAKELRNLLSVSAKAQAQNLPEHQSAPEGTFKSIWDLDSHVTPKPAPAMTKVPRIRHNIDYDQERRDNCSSTSSTLFLVKCLRFLQQLNEASDEHLDYFPPGHPSNNLYHCLSLLSPLGCNLEALIKLLRAHHALRKIETILITSNESSKCYIFSACRYIEKVSRSTLEYFRTSMHEEYPWI